MHVTARASKVVNSLFLGLHSLLFLLFHKFTFKKHVSNPEGGAHETIASPPEGCIAESMNLYLQTPSSLLRRL